MHTQKYVQIYESNRNNHSRYKQSYIDYVSFLTPKIWETPEVTIPLETRKMLARREIFLLGKDIKDTYNKIDKLEKRRIYLKNKTFKGESDEGERDELSRIEGTIRHCEKWIGDLQSFKQQLLQVYPVDLPKN